MCEPLSGLKLA